MHMSDLRRAARAALLLLATSGGPGAWSAPAIPADDPAAGAAQQRDLVKRLEERLKLDGEAIRRYSYVESTVLEKRAADGTLRSSVTEVNEITYRDGRRLKRRLADDLEQDSDGFAIMRSEESRFGATPAPLQEAKEGPFAMEQLIPCFHFYPMGQERVEGRPALRIAFTPIAGCLQDDSRSGRILGRLAGTLWVDEEAHDLVRVRGYLEEPVSFGFGLLGKVDGFDLELDRQPLEPGAFAITRVAYQARGTSFLFHHFDVRSVRQRSGFAPLPRPPAPPEPQPRALLAPGDDAAPAPAGPR